MRAISTMQAQYRLITKTGTELTFPNCKGGYFSTLDEYGLKVIGRNGQDSLIGKNLINMPDWSYTVTEADLEREMFMKYGAQMVDLPLDEINKYVGTGEKYRLSYVKTTDGTLFGDGLKDSEIYIRYTDGTQASVWEREPFEIPKEIKFIQVHISTDLMSTTTISQIMLVNENDDPYTYEPYCGGLPTPNPFYAERIKGVKDGISGSRTFVNVANETNDGSGALISAERIILPCDLNAGDIWFPMTGKVERHSMRRLIDATLASKFELQNKDGYFEAVFYDNEGAYNIGGNSHETNCTCTHFLGVPFNFITGNDGEVIATEKNIIKIRSAALSHFDLPTKEQFAEVLSTNNVEIVYKLNTPIIEQYAPQPIFAREGHVKITQNPYELKAELSASMLVRRY